MPDPKYLEAIQCLLNSHRQNSPQLFADGLNQLFNAEPLDWRSRLLLEKKIIPSPSDLDWDQKIRHCLKGINIVRTSNTITRDKNFELTKLAISLSDTHRRFQHIKKQLAQSKFFHRTHATQFYRLLIYLESQSRLLNRETQEKLNKSNYIDTIAQNQTTAIDRSTGTHTNPDQSMETNADIVELILRYSLWNQKSANFGALDIDDSPYNDADFKLLFRLAHAWLDLIDLWGEIKFNNWTPTIVKNFVSYIPPDPSDLHRRYIYLVRQQRFETNDIFRFTNLPPTRSDMPGGIRNLSRTISLPNPGTAWNCKINITLLKKVCADTLLQRITSFFVDFRHYDQLIETIHKGMGPKNISWQEWLSIKNTLSIISDVVREKSQYLSCTDEEKLERSVLMVDLRVLGETISQATNIPHEKSLACLKLMTFDHKNKLDIFDQPLISISENMVLFTPYIVKSGHPTLTLENLIETHGLTDFSVRGIPFEKSIASQLKHIGINAVADTFTKGDKKEMNYDVICWWKNTIVLIEAKCVKTSFTGVDDFKVWKAVEKSIDQLKLRKQTLKDYWATLRTQRAELHLPENCPSDDNIICISVTNSMRFTGLERDGVICTDDLALMKFFDPEKNPIYSWNGNNETIVGYVSNRSGPATPESLVEYLRRPPQIESLKNAVHIVMRPHLTPRLKKPIFLPYYEYNGSLEQTVNALNH